MQVERITLLASQKSQDATIADLHEAHTATKSKLETLGVEHQLALREAERAKQRLANYSEKQTKEMSEVKKVHEEVLAQSTVLKGELMSREILHSQSADGNQVHTIHTI